MAYDEKLAQRVRKALAGRKGVVERKMFGGLAFMLRGNMCCGVVGEDLMLRVGSQRYEETLALPHARPMDFTGRPLKGFLYVAPAGLADGKALDRWIQRALAFVDSLPAK